MAKLFGISFAECCICLCIHCISEVTLSPEAFSFNVAVASFVADSTSTMSQEEVQRLSDEFYNNLKVRLDSDRASLPVVIGVWSPDTNGRVEGSTQDERRTHAQLPCDTFCSTAECKNQILLSMG